MVIQESGGMHMRGKSITLLHDVNRNQVITFVTLKDVSNLINGLDNSIERLLIRLMGGETGVYAEGWYESQFLDSKRTLNLLYEYYNKKSWWFRLTHKLPEKPKDNLCTEDDDHLWAINMVLDKPYTTYAKSGSDKHDVNNHVDCICASLSLLGEKQYTDAIKVIRKWQVDYNKLVELRKALKGFNSHTIRTIYADKRIIDLIFKYNPRMWEMK